MRRAATAVNVSSSNSEEIMTAYSLTVRREPQGLPLWRLYSFHVMVELSIVAAAVVTAGAWITNQWDAGTVAKTSLAVSAALLLYFAPTIVAERYGRERIRGIALLNLFFAWLPLFWFILLAWARFSTAATKSR
jgi:Superinfection immunity protein